eukprot:352193-Chlamydomonas_euryale.AAC.18
MAVGWIHAPGTANRVPCSFMQVAVRTGPGSYTPHAEGLQFIPPIACVHPAPPEGRRGEGSFTAAYIQKQAAQLRNDLSSIQNHQRGRAPN